MGRAVHKHEHEEGAAISPGPFAVRHAEGDDAKLPRAHRETLLGEPESVLAANLKEELGHGMEVHSGVFLHLIHNPWNLHNGFSGAKCVDMVGQFPVGQLEQGGK